MCNLADFGWELASAYFMYTNTGTYSTLTRRGRPLLVGGERKRWRAWNSHLILEGGKEGGREVGSNE